jgi:hypothetical protein
VLDPPLAQDRASRRPVATEGEVLDSIAACPPLTILEQTRLRELHAKEAARLAPEAAKVRTAFVAEHAQRVALRTGMAQNIAIRIIERQCAGVLLPCVVLPFDDEDLAGATVADVLADPGRFEDATLADPIEGPQYGAGKAKIMRRADGTLWINSFAHGRTIYELQRDYRSAEAALNKASADEVADVFVRCVLGGDLGEDEIDRLRNLASKIGCIGKRALDALLKRAHRPDGPAASGRTRMALGPAPRSAPASPVAGCRRGVVAADARPQRRARRLLRRRAAGAECQQGRCASARQTHTEPASSKHTGI